MLRNNSDVRRCSYFELSLGYLWLLETKNRTLKCLKRHYSTVQSMKNVAVLTEDGAFALFFRPHPGGFDSSRVPTPGNLPSEGKKMLTPGGQPGDGGWAQLESTDA